MTTNGPPDQPPSQWHPQMPGSPSPYPGQFTGSHHAPRGRVRGALAALVLGIVGLFTGVTAPFAVWLGISALRRTRGGQVNGKGMAVSGIVLGSIGSLILLIAIISIAAGGGGKQAKAPAAVPAVSSAVPSACPATATTPSLSPGDAKFVAAVRARLTAKGFSNSATDAQLASLGDQICRARRAGGSEADLISASDNLNGKFSMSTRKFIRLAERDICRKYLTRPPRVLMSFSGSGIGNSAPFLVTSGTLTVSYHFDCSGFGGSGNFAGDIETGNQASLNSDDQPFANDLAASGSKTTHVYPQMVGKHYHVSIDSECNWGVTVKG
jgi:Domain of unknown function (DUF4190)